MSKRLKIQTDTFEYISSKKNPARALRRKFRKKFADGFLSGLTTMLGPEDVCIDCGANIGEISSILGVTGATIHAFEPDPFAFGMLEKSCGYLKNVHLYNAAVGTESGKIDLYRRGAFEDDPEWLSLSSSTVGDSKRNPGHQAVSVDVIDLSSFIKEILKTKEKIAFLKIDIEGAELEILERFVETDILTNIKKTAVEIHPWMFKDGKKRFAALQKLADDKPEFNLNLQWY